MGQGIPYAPHLQQQEKGWDVVVGMPSNVNGKLSCLAWISGKQQEA